MENENRNLFNKLIDLQDLIKKEASLKEMCNSIYLFFYSHTNER